jgi:prolipoprotein diacylglyceryltransferase
LLFNWVDILYDRNESIEKLDSLFIWTVLATLLGARLGRSFFTTGIFPQSFTGNIFYLLDSHQHLNLLDIRLASHGAAISIIIAMYYYSKKNIKDHCYGF